MNHANLSVTERKLLENAQHPPFGSTDDVLQAVESGCMESFGRFDWQAYLPEPLRDLWPSLSLETRLALFACAARLEALDDPQP